MNNLYKFLALALLMILSQLFPLGAQAGPSNKKMNYQGFLFDDVNGSPVNGTKGFLFRVRDGDGGAVQWESACTDVAVSSGIVRASLGHTNAVGDWATLPWGAIDAHLEVIVGEAASCANPVSLAPQERLLASAYSLSGVDLSDVTQTKSGSLNVLGSVGIGMENPAHKLDVAGTINAQSILVNGQPFTGAVGPQGPAGPAGVQGMAGPAGPQGPVGPAGVQGTVGPSGPKGDKGDAGNTGAQGAAGPAGPKGDKGDVGDQGPAGINGAAGAAGPQGPVGPAGAQGAAGPAGLQGVKGDKGDTGAQGPAGSSPFSLNNLDAVYTQGNVGIGTTIPQAKFSVAGSNNDALNIYSLSDNVLALQTTLDGQPLGSYGGVNNVLALQPVVGNVGIGTSGPSAALHILSNGISGDQLKLESGQNRTPSIRFSGPWSVTNPLESYAMIRALNDNGGPGGSAASLRFFTSSGDPALLTEKMTIVGGGNVGIGTTNPEAKLDVQGGPIKASGGLIIETRQSDPPNPATGQIWLIVP